MSVNVETVFNTVLTIIRKDQQGRAFNATEFNRIIPMINYELFNYYADRLADDKKNIHALRDFVDKNYLVALTNGVGNIPIDFVELLGKPYYLESTGTITTHIVVDNDELYDSGASYTADELNGKTLYIISGDHAGETYTIYDNTASTITITGTVGEKIEGESYVVLLDEGRIDVDLVGFAELVDRLSDELTQPTEDDPIAVLGDVNSFSLINVYPTSLKAIYINYLKMPATPLLDYYVDSNGFYTFLAAGATGVSVPAGATYRTGTAGPTSVNSATVHFAWDAEQMTAIVYRILQKAGVALEKELIIQYGLTQEEK